eukprot:791191-Amphidinium_carterae.1
MRLTFTQNVNKEHDYVNGMSATVLGVHWKPNGRVRGVRVQTDTGYDASWLCAHAHEGSGCNA